MDLSFAGMLGAIAGTIVSALIYGPLVAAVERFWRGRQTPAERVAPRQDELGLLRRGVLAADITVCASVGYWLGRTVGG